MDAHLEAERDALQSECDLLRREAARLIAANRELEARLAATTAERDRLREFLARIDHSLPWRIIQTLRGWMGRRW
jgi:chromosome segregation ATPase